MTSRLTLSKIQDVPKVTNTFWSPLYPDENGRKMRFILASFYRPKVFCVIYFIYAWFIQGVPQNVYFLNSNNRDIYYYIIEKQHFSQKICDILNFIWKMTEIFEHVTSLHFWDLMTISLAIIWWVKSDEELRFLPIRFLFK